MSDSKSPVVTVEGYDISVVALGHDYSPPYLLFVEDADAVHKYILKKKEPTLWEKWLEVPDGSIVEVQTSDSIQMNVGYKISGDGGGLVICEGNIWPDWYVEEKNLESFTVVREAN